MLRQKRSAWAEGALGLGPSDRRTIDFFEFYKHFDFLKNWDIIKEILRQRRDGHSWLPIAHRKRNKPSAPRGEWPHPDCLGCRDFFLKKNRILKIHIQ